MTRKTVSERRMAGANKQIAELTQALHEAREYGTLLANDVRDKAGLIKHLKGSNNRLRSNLAVAELAEKSAKDNLAELSDTSARIIADKDAEVKGKQDKLNYLHGKYVSSLHEIIDLKDGLREVTKDARSWKRGFFALIAITVIAQVVNYVAG